MEINNIISKIQGHESAELFTYDKIDKNSFNTYAFDKLSGSNISGLPICFYRSKDDGKLYITLEDNSHVLIIGATGSGKTTGYINILLNMLAELANSSCVINDPKGELYTALAKKFQDKGYKVHTLNFRNPTKSDYWNPMTKLFYLYQDAMNVKNEVGVHTENGKNYNIFKGKIYRSQDELNFDIKEEEQELLAQAENELNNIVTMFIIVDNKMQPDWQRSAKNILKAIIYGMLEDSKGSKSTRDIITVDNFSMQTVLNIYDTFSDYEDGSYNDNGFFTDRPISSKAYQLAKPQLLNNAVNTRRGVIFSFEAALENCRNSAVTRLMSTNTIDVERFDEQKTAVFIQYSDEREENYQIIEYFMIDLYSRLVKTAEKKGGVLTRPFYFVWDEFGNFPPIHRFSNMMTACRSRNIWLILVLQDYAQLDAMYEKNAAAIKNNANIRMFYGTNDISTMQAFSSECLHKTQLSPLCAINGQNERIENFNIETVPLVTVSDLNTIKEGLCYVKIFRKNPMKSYFERSYNCPEFDYEKADINKYDTGIKLSHPKYRFNFGHYGFR